MMLDWLGDTHQDSDCKSVATLLEKSIAQIIARGEVLTYDLGGTAGTTEVGEAIRVALAELLNEHYAVA